MHHDQNPQNPSAPPNPGGGPGNVLPNQQKPAPQSPLHKPIKLDKKNYSGLAVFLAIILFGVMVMLGERLIFDLNRYLNPVIDKEYTQWKNELMQQGSSRRGYDMVSPKTPVRSFEMAADSTGAVSKTRLYYAAPEKGRYMMWKMVIHAAVIIPIFVFAFVLFYFKRKNKQLLPLLVAFMAFAFWMMFHLLGETVKFVMDEYRNVAIYVILVVLAAVFGVLAYYTQAKHHKAEGR